MHTNKTKVVEASLEFKEFFLAKQILHTHIHMHTPMLDNSDNLYKLKILKVCFGKYCLTWDLYPKTSTPKHQYEHLDMCSSIVCFLYIIKLWTNYQWSWISGTNATNVPWHLAVSFWKGDSSIEVSIEYSSLPN